MEERYAESKPGTTAISRKGATLIFVLPHSRAAMPRCAWNTLSSIQTTTAVLANTKRKFVAILAQNVLNVLKRVMAALNFGLLLL